MKPLATKNKKMNWADDGTKRDGRAARVSRRSVGIVRDGVVALAADGTLFRRRAYSKRVPRTNCALRSKKCAPRISSGIYF